MKKSRHSHRDTPDGAKVHSEAEIRGWIPDTVTVNDNSDKASVAPIDDARIESIVRRLQLTPEAWIDASKVQLNELIRTAVADSQPALSTAQVDAMLEKSIAAERIARESFVEQQLKAHIASTHVPEMAAIDEKITALEQLLSSSRKSSDAAAQVDETALRTLIASALDEHDALRKAQSDAAAAVTTWRHGQP